MLWLLAVLVVGLEIPYPLVHGDARTALTIATVLVFASFSMTHAFVTRGTLHALTLLVVGVLGLGAEIVGVHTGIPFGTYRYANDLGPQVFGVPALVGAAWLMMAHPAVAVARRLTTSQWTRWVVAAIALASWDVFLDPQMVAAHHWRWAGSSLHLPGVAQVPLSNFGGWLLVALILTALLVRRDRSPQRSDSPAVALWLWTWLSSALANVAFFARPAVALWGFVAMGVVGVPLIRSFAVAR